MKVGIIGLPQVGKKTLFELLTGQQLVGDYSGIQEVKTGSAVIRDNRFDRLVEIYQPKKNVPATLDVVLLPKFDKETVSSGEFAQSLEQCDALCHVVRAFSDENVFHADGSVDALRDIENVFTELILRDLILVEKRLERMGLEAKKGVAGPQADREKEILTEYKTLLDENRPLSDYNLKDADRKLMSTYKFLTRKPMIMALNVDDDKIHDSSLIDPVKARYPDGHVKVMALSAKIEAELSSLSPEERAAFFADLHIEESALNLLSALCFEALGLISFFTVGPNEVHHWNVVKGALAPQAAGVIHSDLERGFIRAEIFTCTDMFELGSEAAIKEQGRWQLKGKDYALQDGDIMLVRFNV